MNVLVIGGLNPLLTKWFDRLALSDVSLTTYVSPSVEFAEHALKYVSKISAIIISLDLEEKKLDELVSRIIARTKSSRNIHIGACHQGDYIRIYKDGVWKNVDCGDDIHSLGKSLGLFGADLIELDKPKTTKPKDINKITYGAFGAEKNIDSGQRYILTPRQLEVLQCVNQGMSNKEIARELCLSEGTVKVHCKAIFRALGVSNRTQAAVMST